MKENKYYTPDNSEFHVGFEYEHGPLGSPLWNKKVVQTRLFYGIDGATRVKYLDQEDIESLGFEFVKKDYPWLVFTKENIYLHFKHENETPQIILSYSEGSFASRCFYGWVKNKSELKRILKQIGYEG